MPRTSSSAVAEIIEVQDSIPLTPFIETAAALMEGVVATAVHSEERLELIERWLSAHFYTVRDPRPTSERAGSVGQNFQSKVDLNLATSHYGQQAMILDTTGTLANYSRRASRGKRTASVFWAGTKDQNSNA